MKRSKFFLPSTIRFKFKLLLGLILPIFFIFPNYANAEVVKTRPMYGGVQTIGGTSGDLVYNRVMDSQGNYYITGRFNGTVDFGENWGITDSKNATGTNNIFIIKINSVGTYQWTKIIPINFNGFHRAFIDKLDQLYILGTFSTSVNFASDWGLTDSLTTAGSNDISLTKINIDGTYGWTKKIGGTGYDISSSIAFDTNNNLYIFGIFSNSFNIAEYWGDTETITSAGDYDLFLTKINANDSYVWTKTFGTTTQEFAYNHGDTIMLDSDDNIYIFVGCFGIQSILVKIGGYLIIKSQVAL